MNKFYTISDAAKLLNVNSETLRRWDKAGKFQTTRHPINNYRVYTDVQLKNLVEELQLDIEYEVKKAVVNYTPVFGTSLGKLYNEDATQLLSSFENESFNLIFADPPYNIKKAEWDSFASQKQYVEWSMMWIKEAHRILSKDGSLFICGFSEILADLKWAASSLFKGCKWLVWFYRNKGNLGNDWGRSHESILHLRKTTDFIFNIDEIRIPYNKHTLRYPQRTQATTSQYGNGEKSDYVWEPNPLGAKPKDVLEIPTISNGSWEKTPHPTQKPVELLRKIILASSHENSLILDPFGGSGTTYAVAEAYGRKWIGNDADKSYCTMITERLSDRNHLNRIYSGKDTAASVSRRLKLRG